MTDYPTPGETVHWPEPRSAITPPRREDRVTLTGALVTLAVALLVAGLFCGCAAETREAPAPVPVAPVVSVSGGFLLIARGQSFACEPLDSLGHVPLREIDKGAGR